MSSEVRFGLITGPGLSGFVDGHDPELIPFTLAEPGHSGLELVNGRHAVVVVRDESIEPPAELVFLLDDEVSDGSSSAVRGFVPPQRHALVVEVHNSRLPGLAGGL